MTSRGASWIGDNPQKLGEQIRAESALPRFPQTIGDDEHNKLSGERQALRTSWACDKGDGG
jgi:hypothetical protein